MSVELTGKLLGGRYRVGQMLGTGGMGAVYEGVQEDLARAVALKVLHPHLAGDEELRGRFRREARVVARLGHPNVVQISDFQVNDGEPPFLVMELLHGESLRALLQRMTILPPERVAYIAVQALSALEAAHRANIVHRDVKPDNIFLERTSVQTDIVKVLDFGVAKLLGDEATGTKLTRQGLVVGTLSYMSPEQALGDPVDGRADLYSLAAVMYLALSGKKPFDGTTTAALLDAILNQRPTPLVELRPEIGEGLSRIVERALAKRPSDRFASADEMAHALSPFARATTLDEPASITLRTPIEVEVPQTIAMPAFDPGSTLKMPQRSSSTPPPIAPTLMMSSRPPPRRSAWPWVLSLSLAFVLVAGAGVAIALWYQPWHAVMGSN